MICQCLVSGAEVYISNSTGTQLTFSESQKAEVYVCTSFIPQLRETYTLFVRVDDQEYIAV